MKHLRYLLLVTLFLGCSLSKADVTIVSKEEVPGWPGYYVAQLDVLCPGENNPMNLQRVYRAGHDFVLDDQFLRDEAKKSCGERGDGDAPGVETESE